MAFPRIQGADVCGRILAVGEKVSPNRIGERVIIEPVLCEAGDGPLGAPWYFGSECDGGFADYCVVAARHAHAIDSTWTAEELASLPCSYSTAENLLTRAQVTSEDVVLVTGASGGVGSAAVQLAKARGATVIAVTSRSKFDNLLAIGADKVVDRSGDLLDTPGRDSVDVVIDLVAGETWPQLLDILRPKGRYAVSGAIGGPFVELDVRTLYLKDLSFFGCTVIEPDVFANLVKIVEEGRIKPLIADIYPLEEIVQAQEAFLKKTHIGKIVLRVNQSQEITSDQSAPAQRRGSLVLTKKPDPEARFCFFALRRRAYSAASLE